MSARNGNEEGESKSLADLCVARRQAVRPKKNLSSTAKLLFDDLTDLAFLRKYSADFGVIRIGKPLLAERLGCSESTITRAQAELSPEEIWTRTGWYEGHEITIWFLRGVAEGQLEFDQFTEGATRRPKTKIAPRVLTPRNGHGHFCKKGKPEDLAEKQQAPLELNGHSRQFCGETTVINDGATPSEMTGVHRQIQPLGPVINDGGTPSGMTIANGHSHGNGHGKNAEGTPSGVTGYKEVLDRKEEGKGAAVPQDDLSSRPEYIQFEHDLKKKFDKEVRQIQLELKSIRFQARAFPIDPQLKASLDWKLAAIERRLLGPGPQPSAPAKARPTRSATATKQPDSTLKEWGKKLGELRKNLPARSTLPAKTTGKLHEKNTTAATRHQRKNESI